MTVGISKMLPARFPANFAVETPATELEVVGESVVLPALNKSFYRVVAVDETGKRSGPSDVTASLRPIIFSRPATLARKGAEYRYSVAALRSLGDLRTRVVSGKEIMNFWDVERLRFAIERGPAWLSINPATGLLSGAPDRTGSFDVVIAAELEHDERRLDESALKWGIEKVVSSDTVSLGRAIQRFVIDVKP